jgi:hypothetical protein
MMHLSMQRVSMNSYVPRDPTDVRRPPNQADAGFPQPSNGVLMRRIITLTSLATLTLAAACGSTSEAPKAPPRTAAQQRTVDSTLGASNLPGARGVKGALAVSDSAAAKRRMEDSIAANP